MPVVTSKANITYHCGERICATCGQKPGYPHIEWVEAAVLILCARCAVRLLRQGFVEDLVQLKANVDLQASRELHRDIHDRNVALVRSYEERDELKHHVLGID